MLMKTYQMALLPLQVPDSKGKYVLTVFALPAAVLAPLLWVVKVPTAGVIVETCPLPVLPAWPRLPPQ